MAAIRHTLQRQVFTPSDEKLLSVCYVSKAYKRKKTSFLCLATSIDSPGTSLMLYQVKKNDKNVYKKKQSWSLADIETVDGVNNDSKDMELHIDKVYKWTATAAQERRTFISNLYTYSCGLPQRPEFKNIPKDWLVDPAALKESDSITLTPGNVRASSVQLWSVLTFFLFIYLRLKFLTQICMIYFRSSDASDYFGLSTDNSQGSYGLGYADGGL